MNNHILSNTRVLLIATTLSAMMLAAASMPSLVSTRAFAQQDITSDITSDVNERVNEALTQQPNPNSESEEEEQEASDGDAAAATADEQEGAGDEEQDTSDGDASSSSSTPVNPSNSEINLDSNSEEDVNRVEEDDFVTVAPIIQTSVQPDVNVDANTHVITDEEDCEEANDEVTQANLQGSNQQGRSEGEVGDNSIYVGPTVQVSEQISVNVYADTDVILVEGCDLPSDQVTQASVQGSNQGTSSDIEASEEGSTVLIPAYQRSGQTAEHVDINRDIIKHVAVFQ